MKECLLPGRIAHVPFWEAVGPLRGNHAADRTVLSRPAGLEQVVGSLKGAAGVCGLVRPSSGQMLAN